MLNDSKWIEYRLGDIIKGRFLIPKMQHYLDKIENELPESIGGQYIKRTKGLDVQKRKNNFDILLPIIDEKAKQVVIPSESDIVFHLRLGDVVADFRFGEVILGKDGWGLTLRELKSILPKVKATTKNNKIVLVYGSHVADINEVANQKYLAAIITLLHKRGFVVEEKSSSDPDHDFIFMSKSKMFIKSGGGFSRIIGSIVEKNGGIVFTKDSSSLWSFVNRMKSLLILTFNDRRKLVDSIIGAAIKRFPRLYKFYLKRIAKRF